eukprot:Gb_13161 [translate_table: standard]
MDSYIWVWVVGSAVSAALVLFLLKIATVVWWKPLQIKSYFERQGIRGPPYTLLYGNASDIVGMMKQANATPTSLSHHIIPRVLPHYHHWTKTYGRDFLYWFGPKARLNVPEPELIKEILSNKFGNYEKLPSNPLSRQLVGQGLSMIPTIGESSANMLEEWSKSVSSGKKEIEVHKKLRDLTANVIGRTAFGSSYDKGKHIFNMQSQQMLLASELFRSVYIPGFREKAIGVEKSSSYGSDLLGFMMTTNSKHVGGSQEDLSMTLDEIIDECKTFYFAGHESTSNLLTWTMIILGMHQDWQERGRREVMEVCGKDVYRDVDTVNCLKIVRKHLWGEDASEFNPERFAEGVAEAGKHPMAFMPFGSGPRFCIGQNFALFEAKAVLAMILQRFCFSLSSSYAHTPVQIVTLQPQHDHPHDSTQK